MLGVAGSSGSLAFYRFNLKADGNADLELSCETLVATDSSILALSVAWHPQDPNIIGFTLSDGTIGLGSNPYPERHRWNHDAGLDITDVHRHELEAWTMAFCGPNADDVISGGDDIALQYSHKGTDGRYSALWTDRKLHEAGITAVLPVTSTLAITGSYDDHIRLISFASGARRRVLAELNLGGGVWRLKALTDSMPIEESNTTEKSSTDQSEPKRCV
jgi:diphthamide biosynthesis protein 7